MRLILVLLLSAGFASAQMSDALVRCERDCCAGNGGQWDSLSRFCNINESASGFPGYSACEDSCIAEAGRTIGSGGNLCCAPGFVALMLAGYLTVRK
ncbi:MAG: hypothetical protein U0R44_07215 [Candidatus Micrarchaeia archaeon]